MNQIEVQILGQGYRLGCPDGGEKRLREAAERVNATMTRIRDAGKVRARDRIAVLAALNMAFEQPQPPARRPPTSLVAPTGEPETEAERWSNLLQRLDQALADDGRLL